MSEKKASILVIDDEPDLRLLYELTLMREGYQVETAETVAQARSKLAQSYDVVLTDMRLPDGLGMELLLELQAAGRPERCIVVTAYGSAENAVEALRAGAFDYLSKPVELKQLRSVVASAVQGLPAKASSLQVSPAEDLEDPEDADDAAEDAAPAPTPSPAPTSFARPDAASAPPAASPSASPSPAAPSAFAIAAGHATQAAQVAVQATKPRAKSQDKGAAALADMVGESPLMQAVKERIGKVARSMAPVHIHGESGTGKELVARALHANSQRADGPLVAVNCGAIPENLLEAEFFGAKKGSYTGATQDRGGFFQAAKGGTLFLDEIGDLPLAMQTKLLRAIQERSVRPLGATQEEVVDVRLVSATHRDLAVEVAEGRFRQDLYYRLNVIELRIPPLRERREDLPALIEALLTRLARDSQFDTIETDPAFMEAVLRRPFPGNVRELENLLHRAVALSEDGVLRAEYIADMGEAYAPPVGGQPAAAAHAPAHAPAPAPFVPPPAPATTPPAAAEPVMAPPPPQAPPPAPASPAPAPHFGIPGQVAYTGFSLPSFQSRISAPAPAPISAPPPTAEPAAPAAPKRPVIVSSRPYYDDLADLPKDLQAWLDEQERAVLIRALKAVNYNRTVAASLLGLNLRQIRYRIERLNIPTEPDQRE